VTCFEAVISTFSSLGTVGAFWASYRLYRLQQTVENAKKPDVKIWFRQGSPQEGNLGILTFVNLGEKALPVKELVVVDGEGTVRHTLQRNGEQITDWLVTMGEVHTVTVHPTGGTVGRMLKLRAHFYTGKFQFVDIDTTWLGPYRLNEA